MFLKQLYTLLLFVLFMSSCSIQQKLSSSADAFFLKETSMSGSHIGIAVFDPMLNKNIFSHQADKLFVPASNTKIVTCYAAMKYLPSKLPAAYLSDLDTAVLITPTGDPSFLHPDFSTHPLFDKLKGISKPLYIRQDNWYSDALAGGWSWEDYSEDFMTERTTFPVYGNQIHWYQEKSKKENPSYPGDTVDVFIYSNPEVNWPVNFSSIKKSRFEVKRDQYENAFMLVEGLQASGSTSVPYITKGIETGIELLHDSLGKSISIADAEMISKLNSLKYDTVYSQYTDSLLKIMMHRSDNFYADQCLEMVSQQWFQKMDESAIINELLSKDLSAFPQKPRWVDGSGLSRYNLFSPDDMVFILNKMKNEQPWERIKTIFPKVGNGTLSRYKTKSGEFIYAKTGSMGGVMNLSGFIFTDKKKWLIFSVMINNTQTPFSIIRKQMNGFLERVAELN